MVYDVAICGAGAVGLATAYQLINNYPELKIVILEKEKQVSQHQTGNNTRKIPLLEAVQFVNLIMSGDSE